MLLQLSKNQKTFISGKSWTYWYGEILAMICEDMMQSYLGIDDSDVDGALGCTPKSRIAKANGLGWLNGISGEDSLAYASVFQFGAWLTRNFGGVKFIKELATNPLVDMESVLSAVNTVNGTSYTQESLLQKFAGDMLKEEESKGFNQAAPTYPDQAAYTCAYTDSSGNQQTYAYPLTAINLWDPFYAWCDQNNNAKYIANQTIPFSSLPKENTFKKATYSGSAPSVAYKGPAMFNSGTVQGKIGPYGSMLIKLGTATMDNVTIYFYNTESSEDTITIYAR